MRYGHVPDREGAVPRVQALPECDCWWSSAGKLCQLTRLTAQVSTGWGTRVFGARSSGAGKPTIWRLRRQAVIASRGNPVRLGDALLLWCRQSEALGSAPISRRPPYRAPQLETCRPSGKEGLGAGAPAPSRCFLAIRFRAEQLIFTLLAPMAWSEFHRMTA